MFYIKDMDSKQLRKFLWFFLLCWKCHFKHVLSSADGIFTCPGFWMDKSAYNLTCEVYTASVNATMCPGGSGELLFRFTPYGGVKQTYCTVSSYFDAGCDKTFNSKRCRCKEKTNNDTYVLEYMVTADVTTQMGGSWSCEPVCLDSNYFPVGKNIPPNGNCTNVVIVTPSTTAITTLASESPEPTKPHAWCIALIVLSPIFFLIGVVILVLIIIWICGFFSRRARKRKSDSQKKAWRIAEIIVAVLILVLGVIAIIVASSESKTCKGWCCIANIVLGSSCIVIALVIVILLILILCECIKRKQREQLKNEDSDAPHSGPDDQPPPGRGKEAERGNKTNLKKTNDIPQRDAPHSGTDDQPLPGPGKVPERENRTREEEKNGTQLSATHYSGSGEPQQSSQSPKKKHKKKKHRDSEESSLHLSKLRSDSATSSESTSNGAAAIQSQPAPSQATPRPLPAPRLTSVERNSSIDLLPLNTTLPPIKTNLKDFKEH